MIALDVTQRGDWHIVSVVGDLDVTSSPQVRNEVVRLITDGANAVLLDLTAVPFIDSFGLGVLVSALKRTRSSGGDLTLVVTEPNVRRLLTLTGLDGVFQVAESVDEVVGA